MERSPLFQFHITTLGIDQGIHAHVYSSAEFSIGFGFGFGTKTGSKLGSGVLHRFGGMRCN